MNQTKSLLTLYADFENGLRYIQDALAAVDLEVQRSFDLQAARANHAGCTCPRHGTVECTCQMVVLLVYELGRDQLPATLVAHGLEGIIHFALVDVPGSNPGREFKETIQKALDPLAFTQPATWEWSHAT